MNTLGKLACHVLSFAGLAGTAANTFAGDCHIPTACQCESCCQEAKRIKRPKLKIADPPDAEVAFAVAAVARPGQSLRISPEAAKRGLQESVKKELAESSPGKSAEQRLDALEKDVDQIKDLMVKLTIAVDKLASTPK